MGDSFFPFLTTSLVFGVRFLVKKESIYSIAKSTDTVSPGIGIHFQCLVFKKDELMSGEIV